MNLTPKYLVREHDGVYGKQFFYSYESKGDTTVNGITYKKCHYYPGEEPDRSHDSVIALLREQDSVVYCLNNNALIDAEKDKEAVLYDFVHPQNMESLRHSSGDIDYATDSISAGGHSLMRIKFSDHFYLVEGIGFDSSLTGDLLYPFKPMATGVQAMGDGTNWVVDYVYLWYVKENGNIIYYGQTYSGSDGISQIKTDATDKIDDAYYNLQGARVAADQLTPGIYIHNHKKVVVR